MIRPWVLGLVLSLLWGGAFSALAATSSLDLSGSEGVDPPKIAPPPLPSAPQVALPETPSLSAPSLLLPSVGFDPSPYTSFGKSGIAVENPASFLLSKYVLLPSSAVNLSPPSVGVETPSVNEPQVGEFLPPTSAIVHPKSVRVETGEGGEASTVFIVLPYVPRSSNGEETQPPQKETSTIFGVPALEDPLAPPPLPRAGGDPPSLRPTPSRSTPTPRSSPTPTPETETFTILSDPPSYSHAGVVVAAAGALGIALLALYHRIQDHCALDSRRRKAVYEAVSSSPGIDAREVARRTGISYTTATYHLSRLVEARFLVAVPDSNRIRYYRNGGHFSEAERELLHVLLSDDPYRILSLVAGSPGIYRSELSKRLHVSPSTINWHLRRLLKGGWVLERRVGRSTHLFVDSCRIQPLLSSILSKDSGSSLPPDVRSRIQALQSVSPPPQPPLPERRSPLWTQATVPA